jgi:hypothetical protein
MSIDKVTSSIFLFLLAGLCEIGGGWLVWQWLREARGLSWGLFGGLILILYGIIPRSSRLTSVGSMQPTEDFSSFCRLRGVGFWMGINPIVSIWSAPQ